MDDTQIQRDCTVNASENGGPQRVSALLFHRGAECESLIAELHRGLLVWWCFTDEINPRGDLAWTKPFIAQAGVRYGLGDRLPGEVPRSSYTANKTH